MLVCRAIRHRDGDFVDVGGAPGTEAVSMVVSARAPRDRSGIGGGGGGAPGDRSGDGGREDSDLDVTRSERAGFELAMVGSPDGEGDGWGRRRSVPWKCWAHNLLLVVQFTTAAMG